MYYIHVNIYICIRLKHIMDTIKGLLYNLYAHFTGPSPANNMSTTPVTEEAPLKQPVTIVKPKKEKRSREADADKVKKSKRHKKHDDSESESEMSDSDSETETEAELEENEEPKTKTKTKTKPKTKTKEKDIYSADPTDPHTINCKTMNATIISLAVPKDDLPSYAVDDLRDFPKAMKSPKDVFHVKIGNTISLAIKVEQENKSTDITAMYTLTVEQELEYWKRVCGKEDVRDVSVKLLQTQKPDVTSNNNAYITPKALRFLKPKPKQKSKPANEPVSGISFENVFILAPTQEQMKALSEIFKSEKS